MTLITMTTETTAIIAATEDLIDALVAADVDDRLDAYLDSLDRSHDVGEYEVPF